jgi:hypothetical protein
MTASFLPTLTSLWRSITATQLRVARSRGGTYVIVPAIPAPVLKERIDELKRETFSQHDIGTVCLDLRIRRAHAVTGQFARDTLRSRGVFEQDYSGTLG